MPQNASDEIHDGILTHTVNLLRVAAGQRLKVLSMLEALENKLVADLNTVVGKTPATISRLQALLKQTQSTIATAYKAIADNQGAALSKIAQLEATKTANIVNTALKVPLVSVGHTPAQLAAIAGKSFVQGKHPAEWWKAQDKALQDKFATAMREGMLKGEPIDKLVQRVRGTKAASYTDGIMVASKAQAEALVRTSVITVANEARIAEIMEQGGVVKGIQWVATLDSRTTPICRALDGKQWTVPELKPVDHDKLFPGPTAHWQCRSTQIPVTRSWAELAGPNSKLKNTAGIEGNYEELLAKKMEAAGMKPPAIDQAMTAAKVKLDGNGTSGTVTFESWLATKSDAEVDQILGPGKGKLWRSGQVSISQMTDQSNRPLTLGELQAMVAANSNATVAKEGDGGLTLQQRQLLEQSMAHGVKTGKVLTHYVDADTGEVLSIEGSGLDPDTVLKLQAIKRLHVFQNSLDAGEVWTDTQLGMFGKLQGFERATMVGPTGRPVTLQVKPGQTFNQENAAALWAQFQALKNTKTIPQTQQKLISAAAKEGSVKVTLGKADEVKLPPGTFNQQFPELLQKPAPFHDPVAEEAAAKVKAAEEEAATAKAQAEATAKAQAEEAKAAELLAQREAAAQANADAYQARSEATDALKAAEAAEATAAAEAAALKAKNDAAYKEIGDVMANPTGKTLLAKSLAKVMKDQQGMQPHELLEQAKVDAAAAQAKASAAAALSGYKKKALADEEPTPAQKKALETLDPAAKTTFLEGIAAIKAAKLAEAQAAEAAKQAAIAAHQAKLAEEAAKAAEALAAKKAAAAAKSAETKAKNKAAKAALATPIPTTPQPTNIVAPVAEGAFPSTPSAVTVVKKLGGSTGAELVQDPATGLLYVRKKGASADHLREEMTADRIYGLMGAPTPDGKLYETAAGPVKMTAYLGDDATTLQNFLAVAAPAEKAAVVAQLQKHFVLDALLGNWDVVGLSGDNVLVAKDLTPFRVDNGGSLRFKAMGGKKPAAQFSDKVLELETMRDPSVNPSAAPIFKGITDADLVQQTKAIVAQREEILAALPPELREKVGKRIDYLADRFKVPAEAPEPAQAAVAADVPAKVVAARLNGHGVLGDGGDVEDLHTLVWQEKDTSGKDVTRLQFKLTLAGSQRLVNAVGESKLAAAPIEPGANLNNTAGMASPPSNVHPKDNFWPSLLAAAKTVSLHAADGAYNQSTIATFNTKAAELAHLLVDKSLDAEGKKMVQQYMAAVGTIQTAMNDKKALPAGALKQFVYVPPKTPAAAAPAPVAGLEIYKTAKTFVEKKITNGFGEQQPGLAGSAEGGSADAPAYKFKFGPDVEVRWIRPSGTLSSQEALAVQGQVEVTVRAGASAASIQKAHDAMRALGVDLTPPDAETQELVYLRRGVYLLAKKQVPAFNAIVDGPEPAGERIAKAKDFIKSTYGVDLTKPHADYNPAGRTMSSFGDGHTVWERFDMSRADVEKTMKGYVLTHHFSRSIPDALDGILNSGGELTPTVQRLRKGVNVGATGGMSAAADMRTGGASYFFTRIQTPAAAGAGLRLKIRNLARLDAISYGGDKYGAISEIGTRKTTVAEWKQISKNSGNETIFKHGLNLLDEIDTIKTSGPSERQQVLDVFKKHGITVLPDGRKIETVVL